MHWFVSRHTKTGGSALAGASVCSWEGQIQLQAGRLLENMGQCPGTKRPQRVVSSILSSSFKVPERAALVFVKTTLHRGKKISFPTWWTARLFVNVWGTKENSVLWMFWRKHDRISGFQKRGCSCGGGFVCNCCCTSVTFLLFPGSSFPIADEGHQMEIYVSVIVQGRKEGNPYFVSPLLILEALW